MKQSESVRFYQKRYNLCIDFKWHLLYSYNTNFFAPIFPTSSIVFMNSMLSLIFSWGFQARLVYTWGQKQLAKANYWGSVELKTK